MSSPDQSSPGKQRTHSPGTPPRRRSRRGRALPPLALAILGLLLVLGLRGALNPGTLIFPAVLLAAAAWLAHLLGRDED